MNLHNLIDCHTHTSYSPDSDAPMRDMCLRAKELGLLVYTITDHCECELYEKDHYDRSTAESLAEIRQMQLESVTGGTKLLAGLELGQPCQNPAAADELRRRDYDFIIGSMHSVTGLDDFYFLDYSRYSDDELYRLLEQYLEEAYEMARQGGFDTLAHLTYPLRYMNGVYGRTVSLRRRDDLVRELFAELIRKDIGLEINTSGLRQELRQTLPGLDYIRLYRDLGGKYVTIGSDAHNPADLGKGLRDGYQLAADAGFTKITYFENRKPVQLELG